MIKANELREKFLEFFREKGHAVIPSASVIPENDPTVLFTTNRPRVEPARRGLACSTSFTSTTGERRLVRKLRRPVRTGCGTASR